MCGLMRRTSCQKIKKKLAKNNNPKVLKTTFTSRYKCGLKGKDGFQSLSF